MGIKFTNFARAKLTTPPSGTTGLSFTVEASRGALYPTLGAGDYFYGVFKNATRLNNEIVKVEARSGDSFTIAAGGRGLDGTSAQTWTTSDYFELAMTRAALLEVFNPAVIAIGTLTPAADKIPYYTGATTAALTDLTAYARSLLALTSQGGAFSAIVAGGGTITGALTVNGATTFTSTVTVPTPSAGTDAATKSYVDTADAGKLSLTGGTLSGQLALVGDPSGANDATRKSYVDGQISALDASVDSDIAGLTSALAGKASIGTGFAWSTVFTGSTFNLDLHGGYGPGLYLVENTSAGAFAVVMAIGKSVSASVTATTGAPVTFAVADVVTDLFFAGGPQLIQRAQKLGKL